MSEDTPAGTIPPDAVPPDAVPPDAVPPDAVTLRYWAAAKEAAGVSEEQLGGASTLGALLSLALASRPGDHRYARVLAHCSFVVDGQPLGLRAPMDVALVPGSVVEALPPFAGG